MTYEGPGEVEVAVSGIGLLVDRGCAIVTVSPGDQVAQAARVMAERNIGSVVVVDQAGQVVGILSERDILRHLAQSPGGLLQSRVEEIMTGSVVSCRRTARLEDVNRLMVDKNIRHLPVVEDGRFVAMISSRDVMARQLDMVKEMRDAAEEMAKLLKCLKTLSVEEVLDVAVSELPHIFRAERLTIGLREGDEPPMVRRCNCPCREEDSLIRDLEAQGSFIRQAAPEHCQRQGCLGDRILIPLAVTSEGDDPDGEVSRTGFLCLCGWRSREELSSELLAYKAALAQNILSATLSNAIRFHQTHRRSITDALTGLWTRRALQERLQEEVERALRYDVPFCIAFLDVDHLKSINDSAGHAAGNEILRGLAKAISANVRTTDCVARYGGDEFVVLLPHTRLPEARVVIDRLRVHAQSRLSLPDSPPVTLSGGVAQWNGQARGEDILAQADLALYEAKRAGRNGVAVAS